MAAATSAVSVIMVVVSMLCQNGQAEQFATVQENKVGALNSIISVRLYSCVPLNYSVAEVHVGTIISCL